MSTPIMPVYSRFSRRRFLKGAVAATAAVSVPSLVPASVFGENAPSNRVNIGCIGTGNQGFHDLNAFLPQPDCQIVAVSDVNAGSKGYNNPNDVRGRTPGKRLVEEYYAKQSRAGGREGCEAHADFRELIARDDVDAVMVVAPDHWHEYMTVLAVESGKDVYCEKPLGLTIGGQRRMVEAARRHERIVQTGSHERSNPYVRALCEFVRGGAIGKIERVECNVGRHNKVGPGPGWSPMPVPEGFDYKMWLGPAPDAPYHQDRCLYRFRFIRDYSGGQITNFGAHSIDIAQWGLGTDGTGPVEVEHVFADYLPKGSLFDVATHIHFRCKYPNGTVLECRTADPHVRCTFFGTDGVASIDNMAKNATILPRRLTPEELRKRVTYHSIMDHVRNFLDSVKSRREPNAPIEVGHRSATICHLGNIAIELRAKLKWDPKSETFTGPRSPEANRLLDRPQRTEWKS